MMWYGIKSFKFDSNLVHNYKIRHNLKVRSLGLFLKPRVRLGSYKMVVYIPSLWDTVLLSVISSEGNKLIFFLYSPTYYFHIAVPKVFDVMRFDKQIRAISFKFLYANNFFSTY